MSWNPFWKMQTAGDPKKFAKKGETKKQRIDRAHQQGKIRKRGAKKVKHARQVSSFWGKKK